MTKEKIFSRSATLVPCATEVAGRPTTANMRGVNIGARGVENVRATLKPGFFISLQFSNN